MANVGMYFRIVTVLSRAIVKQTQFGLQEKRRCDVLRSIFSHLHVIILHPKCHVFSVSVIILG